MPAATNKADLCAVAEKEFGKLTALLDDVSADLASQAFEDGPSIKDVVAHRAHWITLFLGWFADGQAGKDVAFPAPGYKWSELKAYNAMMRKKNAGQSWDEVKDALSNAQASWVRLIGSLSDADLYGGPMKGANNKWTTGRWAEAAAPSHYRSAAKFIRACLRAAQSADR
ncbi:hypothetical protein shim_04590 [Shimia sp. SK013]|uniref:ClbS/DfsB family four-helix bundle protein n=1 Tax=Shimia sp. SK013 TaxID=1389006 RepID=UPI0006B64B36|nr:ClbS/DfsB family four-helix bundle protein [Shimia sp. SK013]KPA23264.1 hypothetical protein shim_04590 [Shimia sp. SK013]